MPTTPGGIIIPSPTDDPDVVADLQTMAESIEAGLASITAGITAGTGWNVTTFRAKVIGGLCWVRVIASRTGADLVVGVGATSQGVLSAPSTLGVLPSGYLPPFTCGLSHAGNGRAGAGGYVDVSGNIVLQSIGVNDNTTPSPNLVTGTAVSLGGVFPLAA